MNLRPTNVAILGATGNIGRSTLEVTAASHGQLRPVALTAHRQLQELAELSQIHNPRWLVASDREESRTFDWSVLPENTELLIGESGLERVVTDSDVDVVVAAIVGSAGLRGTWAALEAGKRVALANKETLVMAGPLVTKLCQRHGGQLLPVDSEHSAIFQALATGNKSEVKRIILTASGGPFLNLPHSQQSQVTVEDALAHPTWNMGPKITIDSATMMNKALEIIEARWLFDLSPHQIQVVVHPQSVVHSFVEFIDGAVIAQLSPPDMRLPIQFALTYPDRQPGPAKTIDWTETFRLEFQPPDVERFPALVLGHEVARVGGTAGAVLNAANESAVAEFLDGTISFTEIVPACRSVLEHHSYDANPSLDDLIAMDKWARQEVSRWACT